MAFSSSAQALSTISIAFNKFQQTVTVEDSREFSNTTIEDVYKAAHEVQRQLAARRCLRDMRRIHPLLQGLDHYSKSIEVLCNGTPYLPWIWAPIKLMLQVSSDYLKALESLLKAYEQIAESLPRIDRLSTALSDNHDFQKVLAVFYADIIEFHSHAYRFMRRKAWKILFDSAWARFDNQFDPILASLNRHKDLIDKEASAIEIAEAKKWRSQMQITAKKDEKDRESQQFTSVMGWLGLANSIQEDELDEHLRVRLDGSCDWTLRHPKIEQWMMDGPIQPLIWLYGKPGAGKSVICSSLVQYLQDQKANVFYYFCTYRTSTKDNCLSIFKSLTSQAIHNSPDLVKYVYDEYVSRFPQCSLKHLKDLVPRLLESLPSSRMIIDGLDECDDLKGQSAIIQEILPLISTDPFRNICKILICSRDDRSISRAVQKWARTRKKQKIQDIELCLSNESSLIDQSIKSFIESRTSELEDELICLEADERMMDDIREKLLNKADGMFLWVHLVLVTLEDVHNMRELRDAVEALPVGLQEVYARIISRIHHQLNAKNYEKALRILMWMTYARRGLKKFELLNGIALDEDTTVLDKETMFTEQVLDLCKPLIEERPDGSVALVHFSVKEYLTNSEFPPNIQNHQAHYNITFSCAAMVASSLDFLAPELSADDVAVRIGNGLHGLLPYANEHWQDHLLELAPLLAHIKDCGALIRQLDYLFNKHEQLAATFGVKGPSASSLRQSQLDTRLGLISHWQISVLVQRILEIRRSSRNELCANGEDAKLYLLERDTTLFSRMMNIFDNEVQRLLSSEAIPGLAAERMLAFQKSHASSAFRCRYVPCSNEGLGFASDELRIKHEKLHMRLLTCNVIRCQRSKIGFKTQAALKKHMQEFHEAPISYQIPLRVRGAGSDPVLPPSIAEDSSSDDSDSDLEYIERSLADLKVWTVPPACKREGKDWSVIWDPEYSRDIDIELEHTLMEAGRVYSVHFSRDGQYLAIGCKDVVSIYDVTSKERRLTLPHPVRTASGVYGPCSSDSSAPSNTYDVRNVCFNTDGSILMTAQANILRFWDLKSASLVLKSSNHKKLIFDIDCSQRSNLAASCSADQTAKLWNLATRTEALTLRHTDAVTTIKFSPDSTLVITGDFSHRVSIWDLNGNLLYCARGADDILWSVVPSPDGEGFVTAGVDKAIRSWSFVRDRQSGEPGNVQCIKTMKGQSECISSCAITPDGQWILSASKDKTLYFWNFKSGRAQAKIEGHEDSVDTVATSLAGGFFATGGRDAVVRIWRMNEPQST